MTSSSSRPISSHPAFPAVVALWFAALLGGGMFVLPASIFESLASATGLPAIIPAAEPPLGDTARLAITVAAAILGALIGLFVARQVRRTSRPAQVEDAFEGFADDADEDDTIVPNDRDADFSDDDARSDDPTAWQVWRDHMTEDDAEPAAEDPVETFDRHPLYDADGDFISDRGPDLDRLDAARDEDAPDAIDYDAASSDDDPQRAEADRLVAGLARIRREDSDPRAVPAETPVIELEDETEIETLSFREESEEGIFDPSFTSADAVALGDTPDTPDTPDMAAEPETDRPVDAPPSEPLETLSLPELVARLELALDARKSAEVRTAPGDDAVAFLQRESTRGEADGPNSDADDTDPQAMLRAALARLDEVGRAS